MEISGDLSVTFRVKSTGDMQRIMEICKEFECTTVAGMTPAHIKRRHILPKNLSKQEVAERIIGLLKSSFSKDGFVMRDAEGLVLEKLDRRSHTVREAVSWAKRKGILMRRGKLYVFSEVIQQRVAAKMKEMQPEPAANVLPAIPAGMVS